MLLCCWSVVHLHEGRLSCRKVLALVSRLMSVYCVVPLFDSLVVSAEPPSALHSDQPHALCPRSWIGCSMSTTTTQQHHTMTRCSPPPALQCVSTGILLGTGRQKIAAVANLVGYYAIGLPLAATLMFVAELGGLGNQPSTLKYNFNVEHLKDIYILNQC